MSSKEAVINAKLNLCLEAIAYLPLFIVLQSNSKYKEQFDEAVKKWEEIDKKYKEILEHEYNIDHANIQDRVPGKSTKATRKPNKKT